MPSFGRYELCASVLDVLPRFAPVATAEYQRNKKAARPGSLFLCFN